MSAYHLLGPEEVERLRASQASFSNDVRRLLATELDDGQLETVSRLLAIISSAGEDAPRIASWYEGIVDGIRLAREARRPVTPEDLGPGFVDGLERHAFVPDEANLDNAMCALPLGEGRACGSPPADEVHET